MNISLEVIICPVVNASSHTFLLSDIMIWFLVFSATFSNISAVSRQPVLVVEEAGVPGENHRPWASDW